MTTPLQPRFQLFAALSDEEYQALKADIAKRGVLVPVELDETGAVLDGHHRIRACQELGISEYPRLVRTNLHSDAEKRSHVRALNLLRRHLSQEQRRGVIAEQLADTPEKSNRQIAQSLGVDHKTVSAVRKQAEVSGEIPQIAEREVTRGGTTFTQKPKPKPVQLKPTAPAIVAVTPTEERRAVDAATRIEPERVISADQAQVEVSRLLRDAANVRVREAAETDERRIEALDHDGGIAAARLVATYSRWLSAITGNLLPLDPSQVAEQLDDGDWRAAQSARDRLVAWFDQLIASRQIGLRVVTGGR